MPINMAQQVPKVRSTYTVAEAEGC